MDWATSLFLDKQTIELYLQKQNLNPALPTLVLDSDLSIHYLNTRMAKILGLDSASKELPLESEKWRHLWPFATDESSASAILAKIAKTKSSKQLIEAEAHLKNYRLHVVKWAKGSKKVLVAELLRSGDLLKDTSSRQQLYHAISHEIRTSVTGLKGYLDMLSKKENEELQFLHSRMEVLVKRLDKVVERLQDFRTAISED